MSFRETYKKALAEQRELEQANGESGPSGWFHQLPLMQKVVLVVVLVSMLVAVTGSVIAEYIV